MWPVVAELPPGIRLFAGHTDTVPDIAGTFGVAPSLVIFTEGNHLMALLSDDIVGAFPSWAKSQPRYADLDFGNVVVVTLPQPIVVQTIRSGAIALGNLVLKFTRTSGFYPDIVMSGPAPLTELHKLGAVERQAKFFRAIAAAHCSCERATLSTSGVLPMWRAPAPASPRRTPSRPQRALLIALRSKH